jgi:hypothetical protein
MVLIQSIFGRHGRRPTDMRHSGRRSTVVKVASVGAENFRMTGDLLLQSIAAITVPIPGKSAVTRSPAATVMALVLEPDRTT